MALPKGLLVHPDELQDCWLKRLQGSNIKILGLHPTGGKRAHESLETLRRQVINGEFDGRFAKLREMNIELEYEMHAMSWLLPRTLFDTNPSWFRENEEGERVSDFNMCPSCEKALDYVANRAAELALTLRPTTHRYHMWIDDVKGAWCHCAKCCDLTPSDQAMLIYNAILRGIRTVDPQATQCYLAYQNTIEAPKYVRPDEGIFMEYAPIERDLHRPMADETCEKNANDARFLPQLLHFFGKKNAKVLEYWLDNSLFSKWKKPPVAFSLDEPVLKADLRFYENLGFEDVTVFACFLGEDYEALYGDPHIEAYLK